MILKELNIIDRAKTPSFFESCKAYRRKLLSMDIRIRGFALSLHKDETDALTVEKLE